MSIAGLGLILKADTRKYNYHTGGREQYAVKSSVYKILEEGHQSLQRRK